MFKSIMKAIGAALRATFSVLRNVISIPGRLVAGLLGGSASPPPAGDSPLVTNLKEQIAEEQASQTNYKRIAEAIWSWCIDALIAEGPVPVPPFLPRAVKEWLPGIMPEEAERLVSADKTAIEAHVRGLFPLPGVRPVQPLAAVENWAPEPRESTKIPAPEPYLAEATGPRFAS